MANYTEYTVKTGVKWHVRGYIGTNEATGEQLEFNKRGFKTKKEAQVAYTRAKHDFYAGNYDNKPRKNLTFEDVYQEWFSVYKNSVKESTAHTTQRMFILYILPAFGKHKIDKITHKMLQKQVDIWHLKYKRYKKIYNYTCKILEYAVKLEYIERSPKSKVTVPQNVVDYGVTKTTKDYFNRLELEQFITALNKEDSFKWIAFFRLLAFSGIRRGEALALTWNDINFKDETLNIDKTLSLGYGNKVILNNSPKTSESNRTVSLDPITMSVLKHWKHEQATLLVGFGFNAMKPDQILFGKLESNSYLDLSAPRNALERICQKNNLDMINVHGFRHTHCSLLFEAGVPMKDVKERLGHSDIQTTMNIYTHVTQESKDKSAELFAKYINF